MIKDILEQLGFNKKEISVYLNVLEQGKITPGNLARLTGINRTTVYAIAKELVEKGVIIEDLGGKQSHLVALPPTDLKSLAQKEERDLQNKKVLIGQAINELENYTKNTKYSVPKISFVYEEDLENYLYKQAPVWSDSIMKADGVWWGYQDPSFVGQHQKWIDWFWKECAPKNLVLKLLTNHSKFEQQMAARNYSRRIIKFWNKNSNNFTATTWVNGDYMVMIVTNQRPYYLVQIHDMILAHNMREMFKGIWEDIK